MLRPPDVAGWMLAALAAVGCGRATEPGSGSAAPSPVAPPRTLTTAQQQHLDRVSSDPTFRAGRCMPALRDELQALTLEVPANEQLSEVASAAFTACEDWESLSAHLRRRHALAPSEALALRIASTEIQAQRYALAAEVALPLAQKPGASVDASWLAGAALYSDGQHARARPFLERAEPALTGRGDTQALGLLGLVALEDGRLEDARRLLAKAIAVMPTDVLARQGMGRTLARLGDSAASAAEFAQVRALQDAQTAQEARRSRLSSMSRDVQAAIDAGDHPQAMRILDDMLPIADPAARAQLEQFRASLVAKP